MFALRTLRAQIRSFEGDFFFFFCASLISACGMTEVSRDRNKSHLLFKRHFQTIFKRWVGQTCRRFHLWAVCSFHRMFGGGQGITWPHLIGCKEKYLPIICWTQWAQGLTRHVLKMLTFAHQGTLAARTHARWQSAGVTQVVQSVSFPGQLSGRHAEWKWLWCQWTCGEWTKPRETLKHKNCRPTSFFVVADFLVCPKPHSRQASCSHPHKTRTIAETIWTPLLFHTAAGHNVCYSVRCVFFLLFFNFEDIFLLIWDSFFVHIQVGTDCIVFSTLTIYIHLVVPCSEEKK